MNIPFTVVRVTFVVFETHILEPILLQMRATVPQN
jgi:hypothetical protein